MAFADFPSFLAMGGHGVYVWTCYGLAVAVAAANIWWVRRSRVAFFARERAALRRAAAQAAAAGDAPGEAS